jgi:hypothetical protein
MIMEKLCRDKESDILCAMERQKEGTFLDARRVVCVVPRAEIAYFHAILEGYDDLAVMRTIRPEAGHVEVYISPGREKEFASLMEALESEGVDLAILAPGEESQCGS